MNWISLEINKLKGDIQYMGVDHTNIDPDDPYEMPGGKCESQYPGEPRTKILEGNAPNLDMGNAPNADSEEDKSEK